MTPAAVRACTLREVVAMISRLERERELLDEQLAQEADERLADHYEGMDT